MIAANHTKVAQEGSLVASYKGTLRKKTLFFFLLLAILFILAVYAVAAGTYDLSPLKVISALFGQEEGAADIVIWNIRMPRIVASIVAGWGLAISGVAIQKGMGVRPTHFTHLNIYANFGIIGRD